MVVKWCDVWCGSGVMKDVICDVGWGLVKECGVWVTSDKEPFSFLPMQAMSAAPSLMGNYNCSGYGSRPLDQ